MRLVDSHCHLQAERFAADAELVLGGARLAGVERILVPGWNRISGEAALTLAERHPWLDAAVGVHPHEAAQVDEAAWAWFVEAAADHRAVAVGETGLDFDRAFSSVESQLGNLRRNLALALATGKPAILHCRSAAGRRDAQDALVAELRSAGFGDPTVTRAFGDRPAAIVHSFSGPPDYAEAVLALGLAISFSGLVFRPGEESSAEVARIVPANRLLVETDAPYLSPPGAPRRRNEPEWVAVTARWLAEQRAEDPALLGERLVANYDAILPRSRPR
ncbi:MAG: TatD family hydrolase [Chloroflexota bacterium]